MIENLASLILPSRRADDAVAFVQVEPDGGQATVPVGALRAYAAAAVAHLDRHGVQPAERVAIISDVDWRAIATVVALIARGAVPVPINTRQPDDVTADTLRRAECRVVFHGADFAHMVPPQLAGVGFDDVDGADLGDVPALDPMKVEPDHPAIQLYTSGSTGVPKGVVLSHAAKRWTLERYGAPPGGRPETAPVPPEAPSVMVAAPLYHKNGLLTAMSLMTAGGSVILLRRFDARAYLVAAARHRANFLSGVPTMFAQLVRESDLLDELDFGHLVELIVGSAPLTEVLATRLHRSFGGVPIRNNYGTTEVAIVFGDDPARPRPPTSLGVPVPGVDVRLVGDRADQGELWVRSRGQMLGYHGDAERTGERVVDGWYRTGDLMRVEDGFYFHLGRLDDMFVCGGENVYPSAVEAMLCRHDRVVAAAVVPVDDELKGQVPVAFVTVSAPTSADELTAHCLANGPAYQHPRAIRIVDELPLAGTGKIDRGALIAEARSLPGRRSA